MALAPVTAFRPNDTQAAPEFKTAPHNIGAEQALLGAVLVHPEAFDRVSDFLEPAHFFEELHGRIYEVIRQLMRAGKTATPITVQPFARRSCTVSNQMRPRPNTTTVSPSVGAARRTPCSPIAATGVNAAASKLTPSGMRAASVHGTRAYSACGPLVTTRSPTANIPARGPASTTRPALQ